MNKFVIGLALVLLILITINSFISYKSLEYLTQNYDYMNKWSVIKKVRTDELEGRIKKLEKE